MTENPMSSVRGRLRVGWRIARDRTVLHVPPGHPYSPIPSATDITRAAPTTGPGRREVPGIDLREAEQWALLTHLLSDYEETAVWLADDENHRFSLDNTWFAGADAVLYALMLRDLAPRRVVEVGSGFSSALGLDVAEAYLEEHPEFTFIDPDAQRLRSLVTSADLRGRLLERPVQDVPLAAFTTLSAGDILAIDSSHVIRAGSDVQYLLNEVLPELAAGVLIHVHDIFHPFEYPRDWLKSGTALNEAYAWRTLLQNNIALEVVLWNHFLMRFERDWFANNMPLCLSAPFTTGGLWVRVVSPTAQT